MTQAAAHEETAGHESVHSQIPIGSGPTAACSGGAAR